MLTLIENFPREKKFSSKNFKKKSTVTLAPPGNRALPVKCLKNSARIVLSNAIGPINSARQMAEHYSLKVEKMRFFVKFVWEVP